MYVNGTALAMVRGDSEHITIGLKDSSFVEGDVVELTVRSRPTSVEKSLYYKVTEFDGGEAKINIHPEDTSGLKFGVYAYDIQLTRGDVVKTIVECSTFEILKEITY